MADLKPNETKVEAFIVDPVLLGWDLGSVRGLKIRRTTMDAAGRIHKQALSFKDGRWVHYRAGDHFPLECLLPIHPEMGTGDIPQGGCCDAG